MGLSSSKRALFFPGRRCKSHTLKDAPLSSRHPQFWQLTISTCPLPSGCQSLQFEGTTVVLIQRLAAEPFREEELLTRALGPQIAGEQRPERLVLVDAIIESVDQSIDRR
jgi:hypothetical protein